MKRRLLALVLPILLFGSASAVSAASINVSCNNTTVGTNATCTISINGAGQVNAVEGKIAITGTSLVSKANGSGWQGDVEAGSFNLYGDPHSGSFTLATLTLSANNVGRASVNLSNVIYYNENFDQVSLANASASFSINAPQTTKPVQTQAPRTTTTTKPRTRPINTQTPVTTNAQVTNPLDLIELKLDTVTVEDYPVTTSGGVYYVTVDANTEEVLVDATAHESLTIIGKGKRTLVNGKNSVELIVRNYKGDSQTYQIIITKPAAAKTFDTKLISLNVVNYALEFNPDVYEYTISVPYNTNQVYVEAKGASPDVVIKGAGQINLQGKTTDIVINSTYADLKESTYIIHVKKSYSLVVMWIVIGTLGLGLGASLIYANINRKAAVAKAVSNKNREIAMENRQVQLNSANANVSVGGANVEGTGVKTVVPTRVVSGTPTSPAQVAQGIVGVQTSIPTNPTPQTVVTTTPHPQVKVVKRVVSQPQTVVKTVTPQVVQPAQPVSDANVVNQINQ